VPARALCNEQRHVTQRQSNNVIARLPGTRPRRKISRQTAPSPPPPSSSTSILFHSINREICASAQRERRSNTWQDDEQLRCGQPPDVTYNIRWRRVPSSWRVLYHRTDTSSLLELVAGNSLVQNRDERSSLRVALPSGDRNSSRENFTMHRDVSGPFPRVDNPVGPSRVLFALSANLPFNLSEELAPRRMEDRTRARARASGIPSYLVYLHESPLNFERAG